MVETGNAGNNNNGSEDILNGKNYIRFLFALTQDEQVV